MSQLPALFSRKKVEINRSDMDMKSIDQRAQKLMDQIKKMSLGASAYCKVNYIHNYEKVAKAMLP